MLNRKFQMDFACGKTQKLYKFSTARTGGGIVYSYTHKLYVLHGMVS